MTTNRKSCLTWSCRFVFALAFSLSSAVSSQVSSERELRVMSWNVKNYNLCDRFVHNEFRRDYPKPEFEKDALRSVVQATDPDVLIVQEIGGESFINELSADLERVNGIQFPYSGVVDAVDRDRKLGVLSKVAFRLVTNQVTKGDHFSYLGKKAAVKRGLLEVEIEVGDMPFSIMGVHLKSRYTSDSEDPESRLRREKEARLVRDYIRQKIAVKPEQPIVLLGDFNDHAASSVYRRFVKVSDQSLLHEQPVVDSAGECWTYFHKAERRYEQIDFVFLNDVLLEERYGLKGWIVDDPEVVIASDHRPLCVDISIK